MQRDREFLKGMWDKVAVYENEELERERVLQRDREIKKRQFLIFTSFTVVFMVLFAISLFVPVNIGIISFISFIMTVVSIKFEFGEMKNAL